jgi:hypothetical protein
MSRFNFDIFVVYDHPLDYPEHFAVRVHHVNGGRTIRGEKVEIFDTVEEARAYAGDCGRVRIRRDPDDDPKIVETWI